MVGKLVVIVLRHVCLWLCAGPMYKHICEMTGINILALGERQVPGNGQRARCVPANTQVDTSRTITVEFDANARGPGISSPRSGRCRCIRAS